MEDGFDLSSRPSLVRLAIRISVVVAHVAVVEGGRTTMGCDGEPGGEIRGCSMRQHLRRALWRGTSAVHPASGERPLEDEGFGDLGEYSVLLMRAWTAGRVRPAVLAAEMRTTALSQGSLECSREDGGGRSRPWSGPR